MTNKHMLACRVSNETYNQVMELINGDNSPYESTSEYLYTLIISDLANRKAGKGDIGTQLLDALNNPAVIDRLRNLLK